MRGFYGAGNTGPVPVSGEGTPATMLCGRCHSAVWLLHGGSGGPGLCCQCVQVNRLWLALEKRAVGQHNQYAEEALGEHIHGWCEAARQQAARAGAVLEPWMLLEQGEETV